jgi:hypothetical protein
MRKKQQIFSANEVAKFLSEGIVRKQLPSAVLNKELMWQLHQKGCVKITIAK